MTQLYLDIPRAPATLMFISTSIYFRFFCYYQYMSKKFAMIRNFDVHGVSGTGYMLEGVVFENGKVTASWLPTGPIIKTSLIIFDNMEDFMDVHVNSHPENKTQIIWEDEPNFPG